MKVYDNSYRTMNTKDDYLELKFNNRNQVDDKMRDGYAQVFYLFCPLIHYPSTLRKRREFIYNMANIVVEKSPLTQKQAKLKTLQKTFILTTYLFVNVSTKRRKKKYSEYITSTFLRIKNNKVENIRFRQENSRTLHLNLNTHGLFTVISLMFLINIAS